VNVDARGQQPFVDEQPQHPDQVAGPFHGNADVFLGLGVEDVVGVGDAQHAHAFLDEVRITVKHRMD
jgi:hypothetical protein